MRGAARCDGIDDQYHAARARDAAADAECSRWRDRVVVTTSRELLPTLSRPPSNEAQRVSATVRRAVPGCSRRPSRRRAETFAAGDGSGTQPRSIGAGGLCRSPICCAGGREVQHVACGQVCGPRSGPSCARGVPPRPIDAGQPASRSGRMPSRRDRGLRARRSPLSQPALQPRAVAVGRLRRGGVPAGSLRRGTS